MTTSRNVLFDSITKGSKKLYDGLPALSLDGQALAAAIIAHLARPAIPSPRALLRGLCAAAGRCMERATGTLCATLDGLLPQAEAIGMVVERSQSFWRLMLDGLPEGCRAPLSPTRRWCRRAHCRHQGGQMCLGELPWQPKSANAAVAAPRRAWSSHSASSVPVASQLCGGLRSGLSAAVSAASSVAANLKIRGVFCLSSTSSRKRTSQEVAW